MAKSDNRFFATFGSGGSGGGSSSATKFVDTQNWPNNGDTVSFITGIASQDVIVQVYDSNYELVIPEKVDLTGSGTVDITLSIAGTYTVIVIG